MVKDPGGYAGGAEVQDEEAFVVEVGVEELDGVGQVDAICPKDRADKYAAAAATSAFA